MPTTTTQTTVQDLVQELQNFPQDAPVSLKYSDDDELFLIVGFQAGTDGVNIIIADESDQDDSESEQV
ncbi:MAG: hypothetical protein V7K92_28440 [Nostoc sp.]|uniref:hypothetical protein n=1 Tax=Nostoc sp. TaxID=1180 RepID=UPI002FF2AC3A